jgi:branched-chain amino acid transport system permease protein
MTASLNGRNVIVALVIAGLLLLPLYTSISGNVFVLTLFTRIVIFALAAASLNLIWAMAE